MFDRAPKPKVATRPAAPTLKHQAVQAAAYAGAASHDLTRLVKHPSGDRAATRPGRLGLPERLKARVEALSGVAMDDVRVRYRSPEPARLGALAFARGRDIHLGPGQEHHLPHEAWHVVQQARGRVKPTGRVLGLSVNEDTALETEAETVAGRLRPPGTSQPPLAPARAASDISVAVDAPAQLVRRRRRKPQIGMRAGRISSVPEFKRGSTNLARGRQGSHRTAHAALRAVGRNNLLGLTMGDAQGNLAHVMRRLRTLPTVRRLTGQHATNLASVDTAVTGATDAATMTHAVEQLQLFQGLLPGAAGARGSLTGHGEGSHVALLNEYEDRERRGEAQRFTTQDVADSTWRMLDYKPAATESHATIQESVHRHMVHMKNGWPRTMKAARSDVYQHLRTNHGTIFSDNLPAHDGTRIANGAIADARAIMREDVN